MSDLRLDRRGLIEEVAGIRGGCVLGTTAEGAIGGGRRLDRDVEGTIGCTGGAGLGAAKRDAALAIGS